MTSAKSWIGGRQLKKLRALVQATYGFECHICHELIDSKLPANDPLGYSIDHVVPRAHGGSNDLANLRPAHKRCNSSRGTKYLGQIRRPTKASQFF